MDLMTRKFIEVGEGDRIYEVVTKIVNERGAMLACIIDKQERLKGIITPREILRAVEVREFGTLRHPFFEGPRILHLLTSKYARDIMSPPVSVKSSDKIEKAIDIMLDGGFYEIPVVDEEGKVIGEINYFGIIQGSVESLKE